MADLMLDVITSLDGFTAAEGWPGLWGMGGPDYLAWLGQDDSDHTLLMGATTYRLFSRFAETGEEDMSGLTTRDKVVFSSTLDEPLAWANTRLVRDDPVEAVGAMKRDGDHALRTIGSVTLCRSLLAAGLVDRLRVVVFPVVNGATGQDPFYAGWPDVTLDTVEHRTFDGRLQMYEYVPTVLTGAPG